MFKWFKHRFKRDQFLQDLKAYAIWLTKNHDLAEELTQNVLVKFLEKRTPKLSEAEVRPYAFRMLRNSHLDYLRKQKVRLEYSTEQERLISETAGKSFDAVDQLIVRDAFSSLSSDHKEILFLVDVMKFKYVEAAETMGVPQGTIMSRVSRARAEMIKKLSDSPVTKMENRRKVKN